MASLSKESKLYKMLSERYEEAKKNEKLDFEFYDTCVDEVIRNNSKREINFILLRLKCLYDDPDKGVEKANIVIKIVKAIWGNSYKASFIISVLETAMMEMS